MVSDGTDGQVPGMKSPAWEQEWTTKEATAEQLGVSQSNPPGHMLFPPVMGVSRVSAGASWLTHLPAFPALTCRRATPAPWPCHVVARVHMRDTSFASYLNEFHTSS